MVKDDRTYFSISGCSPSLLQRVKQILILEFPNLSLLFYLVIHLLQFKYHKLKIGNVFCAICTICAIYEILNYKSVELKIIGKSWKLFVFILFVLLFERNAKLLN